MTRTSWSSCLIAGFAMGAVAAYIYVRGEYYNEIQVLRRDRRGL